MLGRRIGSWILEQELGRGGMGAVYRARHVSLKKFAAVKVLTAGLESREAFRKRFQREAELQAQLDHPNVARVLDYLEDGGQWFLVLDYLAHGNLADRMRAGKVPRAQAIAWTRQALAGLAHAHDKGIVHRDIKPANLMFGRNGEIVLVDFGIARGGGAPGLTSTGVVIGTPHYMSPEQIVKPDRVDGRADIYAIGVVLYELLAGRRPFDGDSEFSVLQAHVNRPPAPLRTVDPSIPPALENAVMRALAKSPDDRYPDCDAMTRALDAATSARPAADGTVQRTMWEPRAAGSGNTGPSPADAQNRHRRSFMLRVAAATLAVIVAATMLAIQTAWDFDDKNPPIPIPSTGEATSSADTAATHTTETTTTTTTVPNSTAPVPPKAGTKRRKMVGVDLPPHQGPPVHPLPQPPRHVPLPERPQIAIIGGGDDPVFAGLVEQELERRLGDHVIVDERGDPAVDALIARGDANAQTLGPQLLESGFHIAVIVRVVKGDERVFSRLGQSITHKGVRLHLNAYLLPANRRIGPGWTETAEYTEGSAVAKAKLAFIGPTADLRQAIDDAWAQLRAEEGQ